MVSAEHKPALTYIPSLEEVKQSVFSMNGDGSPGPDGFGGNFYKFFRDLIKEEVYKSVLQFFHQNWFLPGLNSNAVALIPKFDVAERIEDYRPITLANFQFKIISKVLADRLAIIAPKIISSQQRGFL